MTQRPGLAVMLPLGLVSDFDATCTCALLSTAVAA